VRQEDFEWVDASSTAIGGALYKIRNDGTKEPLGFYLPTQQNGDPDVIRTWKTKLSLGGPAPTNENTSNHYA